MSRTALVVAMLAAFSFAGCRDRDKAPPEPQAAAAPARTPTVLDSQLEALDKARAVEQDVLESAGKTDEAMEAAEGG